MVDSVGRNTPNQRMRSALDKHDGVLSNDFDSMGKDIANIYAETGDSQAVRDMFAASTARPRRDATGQVVGSRGWNGAIQQKFLDPFQNGRQEAATAFVETLSDTQLAKLAENEDAYIALKDALAGTTLRIEVSNATLTEGAEKLSGRGLEAFHKLEYARSNAKLNIGRRHNRARSSGLTQSENNQQLGIRENKSAPLDTSLNAPKTQRRPTRGISRAKPKDSATTNLSLANRTLDEGTLYLTGAGNNGMERVSYQSVTMAFDPNGGPIPKDVPENMLWSASVNEPFSGDKKYLEFSAPNGDSFRISEGDPNYAPLAAKITDLLENGKPVGGRILY